MRSVLTLTSFGMLTRGSAERKHDTAVHAKKSQSGRSSGVRLTPVLRVAAARTSHASIAAESLIQETAIECGAARAYRRKPAGASRLAARGVRPATFEFSVVSVLIKGCGKTLLTPAANAC